LLFPLFQAQLKLTKKSQAEQRKIAPQLAELRKKHKKDPQRLNQETMALYREHGVNPLSSLMGCLPLAVQMPVLIGLYQAIYNSHLAVLQHANKVFVFWDLGKAAAVSNPLTWVLPLLAAATTFVQSKMYQPAPADGPQDPQVAQMQQMTQSMSLLMPVMILFFAFQPRIAQALVLYWIVSNIFSIFQQYTVNGWGQLPILGNRVPPADRGEGGQGGTPMRASAGETNGRRPAGATRVLAGAGSGRTSGSGRKGRRRR